MKPTHLDLFSGIGGFALAAQWAGFETIGFSEIDPYASQILKKHWPTIPNHGDIHTVPTVRCDLITGGFPCQPFSLAGKRRGKTDDRHLWPAMCGVIGRCKPAWVLGENVPGIIGVELNQVLADLESFGYRVQPFVIPACAVDAPHRRNRVWIVANSMHEWERRKPREISFESVSGNPNSLRGLQQERSVKDQCRWPSDTNWWNSSSEPSRVDDGVPNGSYRRDVLGNAIVPQVAQVILQAIHKELTKVHAVI